MRSLDPRTPWPGCRRRPSVAWAAFLDRFGHLSDSPNDCSRPTWAEHPAVSVHLAGTTGSPPTRDGRPGSRRRSARPHPGLAAAHGPGLGWSRAADAAAGPRACRLLLREGLRALRGRPSWRSAPAGRARCDRRREDVFLLTLTGYEAPSRAGSRGRRPRRHPAVEMEEATQLAWPETIVGDDPVPIRGRPGGRVLHGLPTSRGRHTGPARVITSLAEAPASARTTSWCWRPQTSRGPLSCCAPGPSSARPAACCPTPRSSPGSWDALRGIG